MQRVFRKVTVLFISLSLGFVPSAYASQSKTPSDSKGSPTTRVVGGSAVSISEAPWQVAFIYTSASSNKNGFFCGGSVVSRQWIVTAAHCVDEETANDFVVLAGQSELSQTLLSGVAVEEIIVNPEWNTNTNQADIALVKLATPLTLVSGQIEAIGIPSVMPNATSWAKISGWGSTWFSSPNGGSYDGNLTGTKYPTSLQSAFVKVASNTLCTSYLGSTYRIPSMLCAGLTTDDPYDFIVDTCQGDSGGPLATFDGERWLLSGIVSFGSGCAWTTPGIYTNVANYSAWISANTTEDWFVTYNSNGGSAVAAGGWLTAGQISAAPNPPTRTNYIFSGWSTSPGGAPITFPYQANATSDFTLYALWTIDPAYVAAQEAAAKAQADAAAKAAAAELASRTVGAKKKYAAKSLAQQTGVVIVSPKAKVSFKVAKSSKKVCTKSGSKIKTLSAGACVVTFTVQEPKPKKGKKPKATKTVKTLVVQ